MAPAPPATGAGPTLVWTWSPSEPSWEVPVALAALDDGGVAVLGWSWAPSDADRGSDPPRMPPGVTWVVTRLGADGTLRWARRMGGSVGDLAFGIAASPDGGIVIAGETHGLTVEGLPPLVTRGSDAFVAWLAPDGTPRRLLGLGGDGEDRAFSIAARPSGGWLVAGGTSSTDLVPGHPAEGAMDGFAIALGPEGRIEWQRAVGGGGLDLLLSVTEGPYVVGITSSPVPAAGTARAQGHGGFDGLIGAMGDDGTMAWLHTVGDESDDYFYVARRAGHGVLAAGVTQSASQRREGRYAPHVFRVPASGEPVSIWTACCVYYDYTVPVAPLDDGGFVMVSWLDAPSLDLGGITIARSSPRIEAYAAEIDGRGRARWALSLGEASPARRDFGPSLVAGRDGDLFVATPLWRDEGFDARVTRLRRP